MKKDILLTGLTLLITIGAFSQTTDSEKQIRTQNADTIQGWKKGVILGLNFSQASFTNWAAGGQNSVSINSLLSVYANYKKNKSAWDNSLDMGYGLLQQGKAGKIIKTDDKIDFASKYGRKASKSWYYAALLNFKTQMAPGYNYPNDSVKISNFLAPAYLIIALGFDYKPNDHFSAFISPVTSKNTFVNDATLADKGAFGVDQATYDNNGILLTHGKKFRTEFGGYVRMLYKTYLFADSSVSFQTKIDLFSNYFKNPQNIDVNWETIIGLKVNKYLSATVSTVLIYDDDIKISVDKNNDGVIDAIGPRVQFKELIAVGLLYKF